MPRPPYILSSDGAVREGDSVLAADLPPLGLAGRRLDYLRIDGQTRLQFEDVEVVIGCPFRFTGAGSDVPLDMDERRDLGPLLAIWPSTLVAAAIDGDLTLRLHFEGGTTIEVPPDEQYEAWQIVGPASRLIVCLPAGDGQLSVWT